MWLGVSYRPLSMGMCWPGLYNSVREEWTTHLNEFDFETLLVYETID